MAIVVAVILRDNALISFVWIFSSVETVGILSVSGTTSTVDVFLWDFASLTYLIFEIDYKNSHYLYNCSFILHFIKYFIFYWYDVYFLVLILRLTLYLYITYFFHFNYFIYSFICSVCAGLHCCNLPDLNTHSTNPVLLSG